MSSIPKSSSWFFLVDANLTTKLAKALDTAGYPAVSALDDPGLARQPDPVIFRHARAERQVIITCDKDFLTECFLNPAHCPTCGLIFSRSACTSISSPANWKSRRMAVSSLTQPCALAVVSAPTIVAVACASARLSPILSSGKVIE